MPLNIELLLCEWVLGLTPPEDVPDLAVRALQAGCGSAAVSVLAGLQRPTRADVDAELPRLLRELGTVRPSEPEALKTLVDDCVARIVAGTLPTAAGAERIAALSRSGLDPDRHPETWLDIVSLIGTAEPAESADLPDPDSFAGAMLEQARAMLGRGGLNIQGRLIAGQLDGRTVAASRVQEHVLDGVRTAVRLGLEFVDGLSLTFGAAPGGSSLQLGYRPLAAYDLGEHGRIEVRDERFPCELLKAGTILHAVVPLLDSGGMCVGLRIEPDDGPVYVFARDGNLSIERHGPSTTVLARTGDPSST